MNILRHSIICILLAVAAVAGPIGQAKAFTGDPAPASAAALIPRQVFFGNPDRAAAQISPDGAHLSFLAPSNGVLNVWVQTVGQQDAKAVTNAKGRPIRSYFWAHNAQQIIYLQDRDGDENFHLYAVDLGSHKEIDLTPFEKVKARLVAADRDFPDEILVAINNRDPRVHDVWRVNTRSGEQKLVFQNDGGYAEVQADDKFQVRVTTKYGPKGSVTAYTRDSADGPWYELTTWSNDDAATSGIMGFTRDGRTLYITDSRGVNTGRLYAYGLDGKDGPTYDLVASDERADLNDVVIDPATGRAQAVSFEFARKEWKILDQSLKADWDYLSKVADGEMSIASRNDADNRWVVSYLRDDGPLSYYLYDRAAKKADFLFTNRGQLENLKLAKMKPVEIKSRDGLTLVSYLTLPVNAAPKQPLPMVLLVHGGPWARDHWGYNLLHQWLANRGYAVLSVNFRGSTGLGKAFLNAGDREWAGKMHDDLIDAVNWAVTQKYADPDKVAIMGGSYGGYATLVGLTFTPDFFAAGVDIVGPSHLKTLLESTPPDWELIRSMFETRIGRLDEPEFLDQISPLTRVDAIRKPLLIGQGKNDPRVKEAESQRIVQAMQAKNLPVTYVVFPDEGHGFARPQNNLAFFAITEAFLAEHLGGQFEPIGSSLRESSADIQAGPGLVPGLAEAMGQ